MANDEEIATLKSQNYVVLPTVNGVTLAYTKESDEGLPITKTKITGSQPCLNPNQNFKGGKPTFWMGELSWSTKGWAGCEPINVNGEKFYVDDRYKKTGL